ncbi:disulfide bond formation protein B [Streptomyces sp. NBC_00536]|uniref:disulfide bond formation protein B n=1 Tax=Streptomyces sp. NBC_00536 TaxID=2975769 RepID=UPI002E819E7F|nr:disulfide bond formation protein B [Streptomyces sp. NBC_00536]WUC77076.1 disulfide bond formation protein B [Streptomyces sp. NBC_00536]
MTMTMTMTMTGNPEQAIMSTTSTRRIGLLLPHLFVLGMCAVMLGGFVFQFGKWEYPCPLCMLQRMGMMLTAMGPAWIIAKSRDGAITRGDYATGFGLSVITALLSAIVSGRQVLLHIAPTDPGFDTPLLGLHLYTWALVTFFIAALVAGAACVMSDEAAPGATGFTTGSKTVLWIFAAFIAANLISCFAEQGLHLLLLHRPDGYRLFEFLG